MMIGFGLRKLAKEYGMKVKKGVAYGGMEGMAATLFEGMGFKAVIITCIFEREEAAQELLDRIDDKILKENRVISFQVSMEGIDIFFEDNPGTMSKIRRVLAHVLMQLKSSQVLGVDYCPYCKRLIMEKGTWKLINRIAYHLHPECVEPEIKAIREEMADPENPEAVIPEEQKVKVVDLE